MKYSLELEIKQPRARVAKLFGNPENLGAWQPGFLSIEEMEGPASPAGPAYRLKYQHGKREVEMIETVEVNNLPEEYSATYEARGMQMTVRNYFSEIDRGTTKWISKNEAQVSGLLMRLVALVMPGCFKKQSFEFMKNFKAFAEEGADLRKE